jgi:N-methylhydantoinase A
MGILDPDGFAGGEMRLDAERARTAFESLDTPLSLHDRVAYAYRIAVHNIAEEVTNVAIRHGVDLRDFTLLAYGAAGPMLLPAALEQLQVKRVVIPPHPGLFSALGLLATDLVYYDSQSAYMVLTPEAAPRISEIFDAMEQKLRTRTPADTDGVTLRRSFDGRLLGQSWETPLVEVPDGPVTDATVQQMIDRFHDEYERRYGNRFPVVPVQGVTYRVQLVVPVDKVSYDHLEYSGDGAGSAADPRPTRTLTLRHLQDEPFDAPEYEREALAPGMRLAGPAIIREGLSTTFLLAGQRAEVGRLGEITIRRAPG